MKSKSIKYIFHDANPPEITAENLLKVLVKVNAEKVEKAISEKTAKKVV